jgi:flavin reductase (DIM6/NTAB) family NADH-FMN oxidoreductase RutF
MSVRPIALTSREFRRACGSFLTGVTVVTGRAADGSPVGITVNSFTSVSLEPPLVLVCVDQRSTSLPAFGVGSRYAVHVLRHDQSELSSRFATRLAGPEKLAAVPWRESASGLPILPAFTALFECSIVATHPAGDHAVIVGRVERVDVRDTDDPLGFYRGAYMSVARESAQPIPEEAAELWRLGWA